MIITIIKKGSDIIFTSKVKQNITKRRKKKPAKDNKKFGEKKAATKYC